MLVHEEYMCVFSSFLVVITSDSILSSLNLERDNLLYGSVVQQKGTQTSMKNIFQKCMGM